MYIIVGNHVSKSIYGVLMNINDSMTLTENENRFKEIVESLPDTVFEADENGVITLLNPSGLIEFGYTKEDVAAGINTLQLFVPEERELLLEHFKSSSTDRNKYNEYLAVRKNGSTFPAIVTAGPIVRDGKTVGTRGVIADTTEKKKTEIALKESRFKYRMLFESANDAILVMKNDIFIDCNAKTLVMFGCTRDQIIGQPPYLFSPPTQPDGRDSKEKALEKINEAILGRPQIFEWVHCRYDKTEFDAEVSLNTMDFGDDMFIQAIVRDITARKEAEKLSLAREHQLHLIIDSVPGLIAYVDKNRHYRFINKTWYRWYGKNESDIVGRHVRDVIGEEYYDAIKDYITEALSGKTVAFEGERSGQASKYRYISESFVPDIDEHGQTQGIFVLVTDITERRQMEEALIASEEKYRDIFENSVEGIFRITPEGRYIMANPSLARMYGYDTPEEMLADITDVARQVYVNPERREELKKLLEERGSVTNFESQRYRKDRSIIWVSSNVRVSRDNQKKVLFYDGTVIDITARKKAEEALTQSMDKLRRATGGIIDVIAMAVETRDPYTAGHQRRVANLARAIANEMGLSQDQVDSVRIAGVVHDLGKISIPAEILSMPRKLTDVEYDLVKEHPVIGYNILKDVEFPWPIGDIVLQHHERLNGSGYPYGIKNDEIHLESKIIAVSDVVEAIASHRPYRPALGIDSALEEIEKNRGILYDEKVVDACLRLFRQQGFNFE